MPLRMNWLNGLDGSNTSYLPTNTNHPNDTILNYEPTVNPIHRAATSGWSSRHVACTATSPPEHPYDNGNGTYPIPKKLWVAAIDINPKPGTDPSHPAFYLPGQELNAGNLARLLGRRPVQAERHLVHHGRRVLQRLLQAGRWRRARLLEATPAGARNEYEACTTSADCCGTKLTCINGHCAQAVPL